VGSLRNLKTEGVRLDRQEREKRELDWLARCLRNVPRAAHASPSIRCAECGRTEVVYNINNYGLCRKCALEYRVSLGDK
jgi:ribosomal protein S14